MLIRTTCLVLLLALLTGSRAVAAPSDDSFIAGYAAAVLEREFSLTAPSLRVQNGVISLAASDLGSADRARVVAQLEQIRGVARVVVLEPGVSPPAPPSAAPEPPRIPSEWQAGLDGPGFERDQELTKQLGQRGPLVGSKARQQPVLVGQVQGRDLIEQP